MTDDSISRQAAIDAFYIQADDDGWWTGTVQDMEEFLKGLPSAQPEIVHCRECKYAEVADIEDGQDGYTCQFHRGSIWFSGSYCSWAERRTNE